MEAKIKRCQKFYTTASKIRTPMRPKTEMSVSINVHEAKVCFKVKLKNSLNIQNPESLICEPNTEPVPTAKTIISGRIAPATTKGETMPAAVIPATVADPIVTLKSAVTIQANKIGGICHSLLKEEIYSEVPLSVRTCLKTPPAVMIKSIMAIPEMASPNHFMVVSIELPCLIPKT